jgi:hypothetical protein
MIITHVKRLLHIRPITRRRMASAVLVLGIGLCLWLPMPAAIQAQFATVSVSPAVSNIGIDQAIDLSIEVQDVQNLYAAEFTLRYDATVVEVLDIRIGSVFEGGTPIIRVDNEGGTVMFAATLLSPAPAVNGSGVIAEMVMRGRSNGGTVLSIEALLSDPGGASLSARQRGGSISVGDVQLPTSTARPTSTPHLTPAPADPAQPTQTPAPPQANPTLPGAPPTLEPLPSVSVAPPQGDQPAVPAPTAPIDAPTAAPGQPEPTIAESTPIAPAVQGSPVAPAPTTIPVENQPPTAAAGPAAPQQSTAAPAGAQPAGEKASGLPRTTFVAILAVLLTLVAVLGVVVLVSLSKWYQRGNEV